VEKHCERALKAIDAAGYDFTDRRAAFEESLAALPESAFDLKIQLDTSGDNRGGF